MLQIFQHQRRLFIAQAQVFIQRAGHGARVQRGQVCRGGILERLAPRPLCLADGPAQARGGLCRVAEQHLSRGRDVYFFHRALAALADKVERADVIYLIAPELNAAGLRHIGGVQVHDAAAHGELAGPLHLKTPLVPGAEQPLGEAVHGQCHSRADGHGVRAEICLRHCVLQKGFGPRAHYPGTAAHHVAQDGEAAVFVFMALALYGAEGEIPRGERLRLLPEGRGICRKAHGVRLAGAYHQRRAPCVFAQSGQHLCACGGRQAKQGRSGGHMPCNGGQKALVFGCLPQWLCQHGRASFPAFNTKCSTRPAPLWPQWQTGR